MFINEADVIPIAGEQVSALIKDGVEIKGIGKLDESWNKIHMSNKKLYQKKLNNTKPKHHGKQRRTIMAHRKKTRWF